MQMFFLGPKIRAARVGRGWTQASLSHFTGMSTGDISRIETGRLVPTQSQVKRLADALQIPISADDKASR